MAGIQRAARFDFDEHDRAAIDGHQIQLALAGAAGLKHDLITEPPQKLGRRLFAALAERRRTPPIDPPPHDRPQPATHGSDPRRSGRVWKRRSLTARWKRGTGTSRQSQTFDSANRPFRASPLFQQSPDNLRRAYSLAVSFLALAFLSISFLSVRRSRSLTA